MTPVHQTIFNSALGNCLQACVATLFDKPLETVPNFMLFGDELWYQALRVYLQSIGYELVEWADGPPPHDGQYYLVSMDTGSADYSHACIYRDGVVVHDPHPLARVPLETCSGYYHIKKLTYAEQEPLR